MIMQFSAFQICLVAGVLIPSVQLTDHLLPVGQKKNGVGHFTN